MKKRGFTLAEVLISLAIVAIISAIMLPLVNKFKPDTNKIMYLKTYDSIVEAVRFAGNSTLIYSPVDAAGNRFEEIPFANTDAVTLSDGTAIVGGPAKFCAVMANSLNLDNSNNFACSAASATDFWNNYNDSTAFFNISFTAANGVQFVILSEKGANSYRSDIYFDVNGNKEPNCIYNSNTCDKPDRFKLTVNARGQIMPTDPVGELYINSRTSTQASKKYNVKSSNYSDYESSNFTSYSDYESSNFTSANYTQGY